MAIKSNQEGASDFDFYIGKWNVEHRRLNHRLVSCEEWSTFDGTSVTTKLLGGSGNVDDNVLHLPEGSYRAATLRAYNPATAQWSIWWLDGRNPSQLDAPLVGSFENGVGTFYANDTLEGKPIKVRFIWSVPKPGVPRWEQAFSIDSGETWETNWFMDFTRQA